jgi:hypothetical protein
VDRQILGMQLKQIWSILIVSNSSLFRSLFMLT